MRSSIFTAAAFAAVVASPALPTPAHAGDAPLSPITSEQALAAYDRLKAMDGSWTGTSTKGWTETVTYRVIARESCVLETSFDAHPNETMLTLFHLHEGALLLTHYCVAKNQPRLKATAASSDGGTVEFTFLDATGIPSRDAGHMDRLVITFEAPDQVRKQWYWYSAGKESPMEGIALNRLPAGS
jgi:hypothetical protein